MIDHEIIHSIITPQREYFNNANNKFFLMLEIAMAKKSSDDSSAFIKRDMQEVAENGRFPGQVHIGYLNIDKNGRISGKQYDSKKQVMLEELAGQEGRSLKRIEIDPIYGPLMLTVFLEAARNIHTLAELCDFSYDLGIRTRKEKKIAKSTLSRMLRDPFYCGAFY